MDERDEDRIRALERGLLRSSHDVRAAAGDQEFLAGFRRKLAEARVAESTESTSLGMMCWRFAPALGVMTAAISALLLVIAFRTGTPILDRESALPAAIGGQAPDDIVGEPLLGVIADDVDGATAP